MAGKGDKIRKGANIKAFNEGYEKIDFSKKKQEGNNKNGKKG